MTAGRCSEAQQDGYLGYVVSPLIQHPKQRMEVKKSLTQESAMDIDDGPKEQSAGHLQVKRESQIGRAHV